MKNSKRTLPAWTPYDAQKRSTMVFNDRSSVIDDPYGERRKVMQATMGLAKG